MNPIALVRRGHFPCAGPAQGKKRRYAALRSFASSLSTRSR